MGMKIDGEKSGGCEGRSAARVGAGADSFASKTAVPSIVGCVPHSTASALPPLICLQLDLIIGCVSTFCLIQPVPG